MKDSLFSAALFSRNLEAEKRCLHLIWAPEALRCGAVAPGRTGVIDWNCFKWEAAGEWNHPLSGFLVSAGGRCRVQIEEGNEMKPDSAGEAHTQNWASWGPFKERVETERAHKGWKSNGQAIWRREDEIRRHTFSRGNFSAQFSKLISATIMERGEISFNTAVLYDSTS